MFDDVAVAMYIICVLPYNNMHRVHSLQEVDGASRIAPKGDATCEGIAGCVRPITNK
jgi:hypothetical protein